MLIRGWCWHGTCTSRDVNHSSHTGWLFNGEAGKAPASRSLRLSPAFPLIIHSFSKHLFIFSTLVCPWSASPGTYQSPLFSDFLTLPSPRLVLTCCPGFLSSSLALCSLGPILLVLIVVVPGPTYFHRLPGHNLPALTHSSPCTVICL